MLTQTELSAFLCAASRLAGWAWFDPLVGRLPRALRLLLAAALAAALWPRVQGGVPADFSPVLGAGEFALGVVFALLVRLVFALAEMAFAWLAGATGGALARAEPGAGDALDAPARALAFWLAALAFLAGGGHLLVVSALLDSFAVFPPGGLPAAASVREWAEAGGWLFLAALKLALPLLVLLALVQLAFALTLRRAPGFEPWSTGFALGAASLLAAWILAVPLVVASVQAGLAQLAGWLGGRA